MDGCLPVCVQTEPTETQRGDRSPGNEVTDGFKSPHECWKSNLGPQEEQ